jgi:hypothetical protein
MNQEPFYPLLTIAYPHGTRILSRLARTIELGERYRMVFCMRSETGLSFIHLTMEGREGAREVLLARDAFQGEKKSLSSGKII